MDDRGRPPVADVVVWHRCMELRDAGWSLRAAAQQIREEFPDLFPSRPPSQDSVRIWADKGEVEWEKVVGNAGQDALNAAKVRPRKARQIRALMGKLDMAAHGIGDLEAVVEEVKAFVLLDRIEAKLVGTDAPKVLHHQLGPAPAVHEGTAAAVDAVEPAPLPRRIEKRTG